MHFVFKLGHKYASGDEKRVVLNSKRWTLHIRQPGSTQQGFWFSTTTGLPVGRCVLNQWCISLDPCSMIKASLLAKWLLLLLCGYLVISKVFIWSSVIGNVYNSKTQQMSETTNRMRETKEIRLEATKIQRAEHNDFKNFFHSGLLHRHDTGSSSL